MLPGLNLIGSFGEQALAIGMNICRQVQADELVPNIAVHRNGGGVGIHHKTGLHIGDDHPIAGGFKDDTIGLFFICGT